MKYKLQRVINNRTRLIQAIASTYDETKVISGGSDGLIHIWDLQKGKLLNTLYRHNSSIAALKVIANGNSLISVCISGLLCEWDLKLGVLKSSVYLGRLCLLVFDPLISRVVFVSEDKSIKIWNLKADKLELTIQTGSTIKSIEISPDGKKVISGHVDGTLKVWDIISGKLLQNLQDLRGHRSWVLSIAVTPDGKKVVSGDSKSLRIWDIRTGKVLHALPHYDDKEGGHSCAIYCIAFTNDSLKFVSGSADKTLKIWDIETGKALDTLGGPLTDPYSELHFHNSEVYSVCVTSNGERIISGDRMGDICIWEIESI